MRSLKTLVEKESHVWLYCKTEELQKQFLQQAEEEGFICLNGQKPTVLSPHRLYGIDRTMKMGYLSPMIWFMTYDHPGHAIAVATMEHVDPIRVDYEKFINGEEDYLYHRGSEEA